MTVTTAGTMDESLVEEGLKAFGPLSKPGPGKEYTAMTEALQVVFGTSTYDQRMAALDAYRQHYDPPNPAYTMRKALEAARDWKSKRPARTGRAYRAVANGNSPDEVDAAALSKGASVFGHQRLELDKQRTYEDTKVGCDYPLAGTVLVHELVPVDDA